MPTLVAIGAHCDDIEVRAGGTVARLVSEGWRAVGAVAATSPYYCADSDLWRADEVVTNREIVDVREEESRRAAGILGLEDVRFFGFKSLYWYGDGTRKVRRFDGGGSTVEEFRYVMEELPGREFLCTAHQCAAALEGVCDFLREQDAQVILAHSPDDAHEEHYATACLVYEAVRRLREEGGSPKLYAWEPGSRGAMVAFAPTHCVDITSTMAVKREALEVFRSQGLRALRDENEGQSARWGVLIGAPYAEAFAEFSGLDGRDMFPATYDKGRLVRELEG